MSANHCDEGFVQYTHLPLTERLEKYIELAPPKIGERLEEIDDIPVDRAAELGYQDVVIWLLQQGERGTANALVHAVSHNNLELVKFITAFGTPYQPAIHAAIKQGKTNIVEYLTREYRYKLGSKDIDEAAVSGQLKSLNWLFTNTNVMATPAAIDNTVSTGNLKVLDWLQEHYPESGYTANALVNAVVSNQYKALAWLMEHKELFLAKGMYWAKVNIDFTAQHPSLMKPGKNITLVDHGEPNKNLMEWSNLWIESLGDPKAAMAKCYEYRDGQYKKALESALDEAKKLDQTEMVGLMSKVSLE